MSPSHYLRDKPPRPHVLQIGRDPKLVVCGPPYCGHRAVVVRAGSKTLVWEEACNLVTSYIDAIVSLSRSQSVTDRAAADATLEVLHAVSDILHNKTPNRIRKDLLKSAASFLESYMDKLHNPSFDARANHLCCIFIKAAIDTYYPD